MALKEEKVCATRGKKKASVHKETDALNEDQCSFWHESDDHAQKRHQMPPHFPSPR